MCPNTPNPTGPHDPNSPGEPPLAPAKRSDQSSGSDDHTASPSPPDLSAESTTPPDPSSSAPSTTTEPVPSLPSPTSPKPQPINPLPIHSITSIDPKNGRLELDPADLQRLADDIAKHGLLNPITVRFVRGDWQLVAGNRRLSACRKLGWTHIPAVQTQCTDREAAVIRMHENTMRAELSPVEQACQINDYREQFDATEQELLEAFDCSPTWLEGRLEILAFTPELQQHVHRKTISLGAARLLMRLPDPDTRDTYITHAANHGISIATARLWLSESATALPADQPPTFSKVNQTTESIVSINFVNCFACNRQIELQHSIRTSICTNCSQNIAQALREQNESESHEQTNHDS